MGRHRVARLYWYIVTPGCPSETGEFTEGAPREGMFRALVILLEGDVRFSTDFLFVLRDTLPATVVLGCDWYAFCRDILHTHPEVWLPSSAQAGCLSADIVIAQDMVRQQIVHELMIILLDKEDSEMTVNEIAMDHALDISVGHVLGSLGTGGHACAVIAQGFTQVSSLMEYMLGIVASSHVKKLTKPLLRNILEILKVPGVSVHARRDAMVPALTQHCRGFEGLSQYDGDDGLASLRRKLKSYVSRLEKGKQCEDNDVGRDLSYQRREVLKDKVRRAWPRKIGEDIKERVRQMFSRADIF
ncbi:uncharacterized protein EDB91DRAFT_1334529 [Suillus paluster]|uniref:uncharacterized protein n=1 Tax=Suillus paluster TaxID=48578 RepID=UPI001B878B75|nr:uncharacterized protein EDB91DRAFT_1334529 [Suillus paluster]KAG1748254.1 hypothetical protein EDB91DRAFT_1334529 [Suillus paluster]